MKTTMNDDNDNDNNNNNNNNKRQKATKATATFDDAAVDDDAVSGGNMEDASNKADLSLLFSTLDEILR